MTNMNSKLNYARNVSALHQKLCDRGHTSSGLLTASHSRTIVFEVAPVAAPNWHYGEVFVLVCEIRASIDD